jgi:hypothetical protein
MIPVLRAIPPRRDPARAYLVPAEDRRRPGQRLVVLWPSESPHAGLSLPADGQWLNLDHYWRARLRDGDVLDATAKATPEVTE